MLKVVMFVSQWWQVDKVSPIKLFDENKSLAGLNLRHLLFQHGRADYVRRAVDRVFTLWGEGKVKPLVDSTWALEDVRIIFTLYLSSSANYYTYIAIVFRCRLNL